LTEERQLGRVRRCRGDEQRQGQEQAFHRVISMNRRVPIACAEQRRC
jgi:hypothetical protein